MFIGASLTVALSVAIGHFAWIATLLALAGGFSLFLASALLLFESRYNLTFIDHHIDFIYYLRAKEGAPVHRPDESDALRWHSPEELGLPHVPDEVRESGRDAIRLVELSTRNP